ncbi:MAG: hypothetical protein ACTSP4_00735 [Candidatus Hodarchaeales archaeon]
MTKQILTITINSDENDMVDAMDYVKQDIENGFTSGVIGYSSDSWKLETIRESKYD